ncbi:hypothetical protein QJS04_geneDACA002488 [Acorus gramineus]|uniref:Uncharacterized protein n=1 Tax=Acorus gramineus TaxID=55184 RepID=A0AAV9A0Q5_ACOGR|nr:hypothetical protein QJS04_geneDACA002488 [Acorus gramineus]
MAMAGGWVRGQAVHQAPKGLIARLDALRRRFFWRGAAGTGKSPYLVRWMDICRSKKKGGLGVLDLEVMNRGVVN